MATESEKLVSKVTFPYVLKDCGMNGCLKDAFYLTWKPEAGDLLVAEKIIFPDGRKPQGGDMVLCGSCGRELKYPDMPVEFIEPRQ